LVFAFLWRPETFWVSGERGETWLFTSTVACTGIALAASAFQLCSPRRLVVTGLAVLAAIAAVMLLPNNRYNAPYRLEVRVLMAAPALMWAAWSLLLSVTHKRAEPRQASSPVRGPGIAAGLLTLAVFSPFLTYNFLRPQSGLLRAVLAFDASTGKELWNRVLFAAPEERKHALNSFATPTPVAATDGVFADFGSGRGKLSKEGKVLWEHRDHSYDERTRYGSSSSPLFFENSVILLHVGELDLAGRPSRLFALDWDSGELQWEVAPEGGFDTYSSPLLVQRGARARILVASSEKISAYDPRGGRLAWSVAIPIRQMVPTPVVHGDHILVAGGTHVGQATCVLMMAENWQEDPPQRVWQTKRCVPDIASPIAKDGRGYTVSDAGILSCFELENGDVHWQERLEGGAYRASLVAGDRKLFALAEDGTTTTVALSGEFEIIERGELGARCLASPALADSGRMFVRTSEALLCFRAEASPAIEATARR